MSNNWDPSRVESKIGINFKYDQTLRLALIHPSYAKQIHESEDNSRLEFLGEAILSLVLVDYIYWHFSHFQVGKQKALHDKLIEPNRLTNLWYDMQLGESYPFLGLKEERHRLRVKHNNPFEKAFKALVGAIYIDRGFSQARNWLDKHLISPLLKRYLKPELEHSASDKQVQFLGETVLEAVAIDYLYHHILQAHPSKLKPLARKLTTKENQNKYLKLSDTWKEVLGDRPLPKSFKILLAQVYLHFNELNAKTGFAQTSSYFAQHCLDDDEIMTEAIALLLKDGKSQKWIIHEVMGYPSNKYDLGREKYHELID